MARETDICNMALSYLGANLIIEMSDDTPEATLCRLNYATVRDACLEDINWSFATKRYHFSAPLAEKPLFGYAHAFQLPPEVLRVIEVNENRYDYKIEDRKILTDRESVRIVAIVRVTDTTLFPPNFIKALAMYLAAEIALPLTNSPQQQSSMAQMYVAIRRWAQSNDGRQQKSQRRIITEFIR